MSAFAPLTGTPPPGLAGFAPLRQAERLIVQACLAGDIAKVRLQMPPAATREVAVRAAFLAFLLQGGVPLRGRRLHVIGAWIEGRLDLGGLDLPGSLWFYRCRFDAPVLLDGARVRGDLSFGGCHLPALLAERTTVEGDFIVNAGCTVERELRLRRARVGGDLEIARADLTGGPAGPARRALVADGLHVEGALRLHDACEVLGEVRLVGARVEGDLLLSGRFSGNALDDHRRDVALRLDRLQLGGTLRLDAGFGAAGGVSLVRAQIGGDLDATGAGFDRLGDGTWGDAAPLRLDRAAIGGALVLRELQEPLRGASFAGTQVGVLADDSGTWGERLDLDGFAYSRFGDGAPLDTRFRVGWLERQRPAHLAADFRAQPWRRLVRVLRKMGHEGRAAHVALRRERWLRQSGRVGEWAPRGLRWLPAAVHMAHGLLAGHGYRPWRLVGWSAGVWAAGATLPAGAPLAPWYARFELAFFALAALLLVAALAGWTDRDRRR